MARQTQPPRSTELDPEVLAQAVCRQLVRMHADNVPWATVGAGVLALLFIAMQARVVPLPLLWAWLLGVVLALAWRAGVRLWQQRSTTSPVDDARWLFHYRATFLLHGLAWGAASVLPLPDSAPLHLAVLVIVLAGITASNFTLNSFDLAAALLFGTPLLGCLALRLLAQGGEVHITLGGAVLVALVFLGLTARRAHQLVRENVALRLAEAGQHHLLSLLIETTGEGYWFIDTQARTTDANPAMCHILGQPREALLGRSIFDFVDAENRAIFERQIQRRAIGLTGGYEIALTRADGSQIDCYNQATPIVDDQGRPIGSIGMWTDISERKCAERQLQLTTEALRQKSQVLEDTLASLTQGVASYDGQGLLRAHNRRLLELLDLPEHLYAPGSRHQDAVAFQQQRGDLLADRELLDASGQPLPIPADLAKLPDVYVRRTQAGLLVEVRTRRLPDGSFVRTFADVTAYIEAQRALAARERELRALLDAFPGYIAVIDEQQRYTYANHRFASMLGRTPAQIVGQSLPDVLGDTRAAAVAEVVRQLRPGQPVTVESEYPATATRPKTLLQVTHAIGAGDSTGRHKTYAFAIDISARKAAEEALVAARDEAQRANRAKSQFLSSMSHELRTPLNAILGFGHLLATDRREPLSARQRGQMEKILGGARHLLQLINEVLDLAVTETGKLPVHLQPVALAPALQEALAMVQPLAQARQITLAPADVPLQQAGVQADPVRLKQVLLNLLGNAIKYNRAAGAVRLACVAATGGATGGAAARPGWRIEVHDTGPGLSAGQQARLFGMFERLGAEQGAEEGTGLGLALSRGLVRAMHGEIGVHSTPGQGSCFWIWLPMCAAPAADAPPHPPSPAAPAAAPALAAAPRQAPTHTVLYIEDNPVNQLLMAAMFERLPSLQLVAETLPEPGLQRAMALRPDLILTDIQLPGEDGFAVMRRLRQDPRTQAIPVIAVSANAMAEALAQGQAAGFVHYLSKPVEFDALVAAISAVLGPLPNTQG